MDTRLRGYDRDMHGQQSAANCFKHSPPGNTAGRIFNAALYIKSDGRKFSAIADLILLFNPDLSEFTFSKRGKFEIHYSFLHRFNYD